MKIQAGVTFIEAALSMLLISILLLLSAGLWDYISSASAVSELLESYSAHSYAGAYSYDKNSNKYILNINKLKESFSSELLPQTIKQLNKELRENSYTNKKIDFLFTSVRVDPLTGQVLGLSPFSEQDVLGIGSQTIPGFLLDGKFENGEIDFRQALDKYVQNNYENLAIPSIYYGISDAKQQFLPDVPLLAARALYNSGGSSILHSLGVLEHSYVWDIRVSSLRSDL